MGRKEITMEKLNTIQKREKLNNVVTVGDIGPGGAYHEYAISSNVPGDGVARLTTIQFQKGPRKDPDSQHGVIDTDLLEIVRHRLQCFQKGEFASRENACALTHVEEALMWMNRRVEDRIERSVLGTYNK
jgi:hypothetical protein